MDKIIKWSGNTRLYTVNNSIKEQCWLIRRWGLREIVTETDAMNEHYEIAGAMLDGSAEKARKLMENHLTSSCKRLIVLPNIKKILVDE